MQNLIVLQKGNSAEFYHKNPGRLSLKELEEIVRASDFGGRIKKVSNASSVGEEEIEEMEEEEQKEEEGDQENQDKKEENAKTKGRKDFRAQGEWVS